MTALYTEAVGYVGRQHKGGYAGYDADVSSFIIMELEEGAPEAAEIFFEGLRGQAADMIETEGIGIADVVSQYLAAAKISSPLAVIAGVVVGEQLHLYSCGSGSVYVYRNGACLPLISGTHTAVGTPQEHDIFVLVNGAFLEAVGPNADAALMSLVGGHDVKAAIASIPSAIKNPQLSGAVALFIKFTKSLEVAAALPQPVQPAAPSVQQPELAVAKPPFMPLNLLRSRRRIITGAGVILICAILVWSVVLGYQRRAEDAAQKKIDVAKTTITGKLTQASEEYFLNPQYARTLIDEANKLHADLARELDGRKEAELKELGELIKEKENEVVHKEERPTTEFFDLSLDSRDAKGSKMFLNTDNLVILDNKRGAIYTVSIDKKNLDTALADSIKSATLIGGYEDTLYYFVSGQGMYQITDGTNVKKIISADPEWGIITGLAFFNSNIYLLDKSANQLYKYVPVEGGFSAKKGYFAPDALAFRDTPSIAIDGSVYIGDGQTIYKYTGGVRDDFKAVFPEEDAHIDKILTTPDVEQVYAWDKKKGSIYSFGKEGAYDRQIESSKLAQADDVIVHDTRAFILIKEKIYTIDVR